MLKPVAKWLSRDRATPARDAGEAIDQGITELPYYPTHIWIEPTNCCNFRCVGCPLSYGHNKNYGYGYMDMDVYQKVIDEASTFMEGEWISLHFLGESLVHPKLPEMVRYATDRGLRVGFNTNGSYMTEEKFLSLLDSGVGKIVVSLNELEAEAYEANQVGGDFEQICGAIRMMDRVRVEVGARVDLRINTLVRSDEEAKGKRGRLEEMFGTGWKLMFHRYHEWGGSVPFRHGAEDVTKACTFAYSALVVMWNGQVLPCTRDGERSLTIGDTRTESLLGIWNGTRAQELRRKHLELDAGALPESCKNCSMIRPDSVSWVAGE
jgi:radical SAM protein with 4Fe4S-binding SPASM domain